MTIPHLTRLDGEHIAITGGASGMGAALVAALPALGAKVVSIDLDSDRGGDIARGAGADFVPGDVADESSIGGAVDEAVRRMGGLDCLVHAAGISPAGQPEDVTVDVWDRVMRVNALGTVLANQAAFRHMRQDGGRILNFASHAGVLGIPMKAAYSMSKGAVVAWTRTAAQAWAAHRITVNMISPAIWTPMFDATRSQLTPEELDALDENFTRTIPLGGRLGDLTEDFVPPMAFYCSPGAGFITGQIFPLDGGLLMTR